MKLHPAISAGIASSWVATVTWKRPIPTAPSSSLKLTVTVTAG
jgi:hypothetical protein